MCTFFKNKTISLAGKNWFWHVFLCSQKLYADPDRPKNDKASILSDTIQVLKDLTSQVGRLKSEYAALTDESREVIS